MKLAKIKIAKNIELPIKCDMYVLAAIQDRYGNVVNFQKALTGLVEEKYEENGEQKVRYKSIEPSVDAVMFALPLMVAEGIRLERKDNPAVTYPVESEEDIIMSITRSFRLIANDLVKEFLKCFEIKK